MSRLKRNDKIIFLAKKQCVTPTSLKLFSRMVQDSDNGYLHNYSGFVDNYTEDLFNGDSVKYLEAFLELQAVKNIITYNRGEDILYIKSFSQKYYNNFLIELKNRKNNYFKDPHKDKQNLFNLLNAGKYGEIISEVISKPESNIHDATYTTKSDGFKVPDSLRHYLTGEPLDEKDIKSIIFKDKGFLLHEELRRNLSKEEKRAYCACMAFCDLNGVIEDYNIFSLISSIKREFGDKSFCTSKMYSAINKLLELNLVSEYTDTHTGLKCLKITLYKESFDRGEHYVIIPNIVFKQAFKKLQASAIKLFFYFIFMLNNGEDNNKYIGQAKAIYFKIAKLSGQSQESINNFEKQMLWLRKRYLGELTSLVWGDMNDNDYSALASIFHFSSINDTVLQVRIRKEYFISKKAVKFKQLLALKGRNKKRAAAIEDSLSNNKIDYSPEDLIALIKIFKGADSRIIKFIINQLGSRIKEVHENNWDEIRSIPAYVYTLYSRYKQSSDGLIEEVS